MSEHCGPKALQKVSKATGALLGLAKVPSKKHARSARTNEVAHWIHAEALSSNAGSPQKPLKSAAKWDTRGSTSISSTNHEVRRGQRLVPRRGSGCYESTLHPNQGVWIVGFRVYCSVFGPGHKVCNGLLPGLEGGLVRRAFGMKLRVLEGSLGFRVQDIGSVCCLGSMFRWVGCASEPEHPHRTTQASWSAWSLLGCQPMPLCTCSTCFWAALAILADFRLRGCGWYPHLGMQRALALAWP